MIYWMYAMKRAQDLRRWTGRKVSVHGYRDTTGKWRYLATFVDAKD